MRVLAQPDSGDRAAIVALLARVEAYDGVAAVGEAALLELRAPLHPTTNVLAEDGGLVGYGWTDGASAELAVDPAHRRRGHGTALLHTLLGLGDVAVWAHGTLPAAVALADRHGLVATRELWRMVWEGGDVVVPPLADSLAVRHFRGAADGADGRAWVALNATVFAGHPEQGRLGVADLAARMAEPWFDPADLLLVMRGEALAAYAWLKRQGDEAEVYVLGVGADFQRRGIAAHLLARLQERATGAGARELTLHVEGANLTAIRSYGRSGFRRASVDTQYSMSDSGVPDRDK